MINALLAAVVVSLISLVGIVFMFRKDAFSARYGGVLISIASGVMLTAAVLDLLPEAAEMYHGKELYWALLFGICLFFIMERLMHWYHHHTHEHKIGSAVKPAAYLITVGDALHNFFDGLAIAAAFSVGPELGLAATFAIILHEIPQELGDFVALRHSGLSFRQALFYNLLSGVTAIIGVLAGWFSLQVFEGLLPFLLAFNAGMFIYISCSDLIPALHEEFKRDKKWLQTGTFVLGVLMMALLINSLEGLHSHDSSHEHATESEVHVEISRPQSETHLEARI